MSEITRAQFETANELAQRIAATLTAQLGKTILVDYSVDQRVFRFAPPNTLWTHAPAISLETMVDEAEGGAGHVIKFLSTELARMPPLRLPKGTHTVRYEAQFPEDDSANN